MSFIQKLLKPQDKLEVIKLAVDNSAEGVIVTDVKLFDGGIVFANKAFYELTGYSPEEVIGKNCRFLQGPGTNKESIAEMRQCVKEGRRYYGELLNYKKNGEEFWNALTIMPIYNAAGELTHFTGSQTNITARKKAEEEVQRLNTELIKNIEQLQNANKELETFSYTISHDLQSPLRNMSAFSKILLKDYNDKLDDKGKVYLTFIDSSANRMSDLIHDLLAFAKLGKVNLNKKEVNMNEIVNVVLDEIKLTSANFRTEIILHPLTSVQCDPSLIKQVWVNLIGNAVKYSSKKETPVVEIGIQHINEQPVYYVKDNGDGFDMKHAEKLFAVFQRLHSTDEFEGTGVGLAMAERIVAKHGGRIWAEGKKGKEATFYFTLPG